MAVLHPNLVLYSIGHSNQPLEQFLTLLRRHDINLIADVRSTPYSRRWPWFSQAPLQEGLHACGVQYLFLGDQLGARRVESECYRDGRVDYERVAKAPAFQRGLERLVEIASHSKVAMLCAEKDPLTCHRTILVSRHLRARIADIRHILTTGEIETQAEAEQRLLCEMGLDQADLFESREQRLQEAYRRRGTTMGYAAPNPSSNPQPESLPRNTPQQ